MFNPTNECVVLLPVNAKETVKKLRLGTTSDGWLYLCLTVAAFAAGRQKAIPCGSAAWHRCNQDANWFFV